MIESLKKYLPLISILILISSILKNTIYYDHFNIKINQYVTITEFPLLFIEDLNFYLIYILSFLAYLPFIYIRIWAREKFGEKFMTFTLTQMYSKYIIIVYIITILTSVFSKINLLSLQYQIIVLAAFLILYLDKSLDFSLKYFATVSSILIIYISISNAYIEIENIEKRKVKFSVEFCYDSQKIIADRNYIFIGKTNNFLFMYNYKNKTSEVFENPKISNFKIKKTVFNNSLQQWFNFVFPD